MVKALTPTAFEDSVILSSEQRQTLVNWLEEPGTSQTPAWYTVRHVMVGLLQTFTPVVTTEDRR